MYGISFPCFVKFLLPPLLWINRCFSAQKNPRKFVPRQPRKGQKEATKNGEKNENHSHGRQFTIPFKGKTKNSVAMRDARQYDDEFLLQQSRADFFVQHFGRRNEINLRKLGNLSQSTCVNDWKIHVGREVNPMPGRGGRPFYPFKVVLILPKFYLNKCIAPTSWILKEKANKNLQKMVIDREKIKSTPGNLVVTQRNATARFQTYISHHDGPMKARCFKNIGNTKNFVSGSKCRSLFFLFFEPFMSFEQIKSSKLKSQNHEKFWEPWDERKDRGKSAGGIAVRISPHNRFLPDVFSIF